MPDDGHYIKELSSVTRKKDKKDERDEKKSTNRNEKKKCIALEEDDGASIIPSLVITINLKSHLNSNIQGKNEQPVSKA